jgi:hypothetical protein
MDSLLLRIRCRYRLSVQELADCLRIQPETLLRLECGGYEAPDIEQELVRRLRGAGLSLQ